MKKMTVEEKYEENKRKQLKILENFVEHEAEWAKHLMMYYRIKKEDIPDDEYRACAYFMNNEYLSKPGSLLLLHKMYLRCNKELPDTTKENAFDLLRFRYKMYTKILEKGEFN
jgi:hypothetical protein